MKRLEFLQLCGGMLIASQLPDKACARLLEPIAGPASLRTIKKITIAVGATAPIRALHISDTHLTRVDERDNERKHSLAASRQRVFPWAEHYFDAAIRYARENNLMLLHTGDLQDFVSEANLDFIAEQKMNTEICKRLNFTSLRYHRLDDLIQSIGISPCKLCTYCWDGKE